MHTLNVVLTDDQYARYKAAFKTVRQMDQDPTDEELISQLVREAAAITHMAEVTPGDTSNWSF